MIYSENISMFRRLYNQVPISILRSKHGRIGKRRVEGGIVKGLSPSHVVSRSVPETF